MQSLRFLLVFVVGALLACGVACNKSGKPGDSGAFTLEGATNVTGALDQKDYEGAVGALIKVKTALPKDTSSPEWVEYRRLRSKVTEALTEVMGTDEAAKRAYDMLRFAEVGR